MKISVDGQDLFTLTETHKKIIKNDIHEDIFDEDMKRRLAWVLHHKLERCYQRLKNEWEPKLVENGVKQIPTDPQEFAELVFAQPNYKCRKVRQAEEDALLQAQAVKQ